MKKFILFFIIFTSLFSNNFAQKDWSAKLHKNLVKENNGQYSIEDFMLIKNGENSFQIKMSAVAPKDIIGRDNFISFYSTYGTIVLLTVLAQSGLKITDLNIKNLDDVIGEPDIIIHFVIAKNGFQLQLTTSNGTVKNAVTWDEIFENN